MSNAMQITFTGGALLGDERTFSIDVPVVFGRSHSADVRLKEADVSGRHAEMLMLGGVPCIRCLSRHGLVLGVDKVAEGEIRHISPGDVVSLGVHVRFRIDKIGDISGDGMESMTFETRAMTGSVTFATRAAHEGNDDAGTLESFAQRGVLEEAPVSDSESPRPPLSSSASAADMKAAADAMSTGSLSTQASIPSIQETAAAPMDFKKPADDGPTMLLPGLTDSRTGTDGSKTQAIQTQLADMNVITRMKKAQLAKKKMRRKLLFFAFAAFMAMLATIVYVHWSSPEEELSQPLIKGTDKPDIAQYEVKSPAGYIAMVVDYPNDPRMKVSESSDGIDVTTYTGRDRDAVFRLSFLRRVDIRQYHLSLAQSAEQEMEAFSKRGYVFMGDREDSSLDAESRAGILFFEEEAPYACNVMTQQGTRFFRREFQHEDGGVKWHGMMTLIRDRDVVYRLMREVPDVLWPRARHLFIVDPNLTLSAPFLRRRWESPGDAAIAEIVIDEQTEQTIADTLARGWIADWPVVKKSIDALVVAGATSSPEARKRADALLAEYRKRRDALYNELQNRHYRAIINADEDGLLDSFNKCRSAFGDDPSDLRYKKVYDPREWTCQLEPTS